MHSKNDGGKRVGVVFVWVVVGFLIISGIGQCFGEEKEVKKPEPEVRAVWVSCLGPGLRSPEEIRQMVDAVRKANLNTVIAQIRSRGTVLFKSELEPRNPAIKGPESFDPLEFLLKEARDTSGGKKKLDVHAWFNTFHIGPQKGLEEAYPVPICVSHRDWYTRSIDGEIHFELDAGIPEVQNHNLAIIEECLENYDVDGVNLDFVRYFDENRGYHPIAVKRFQGLTGRADVPSATDEEWSDFRREQVTGFVKRCATLVWEKQPQATFSVDAVGFWRPPKKHFSETDPYTQVFQDWGGWAEEGYLDLVCRMGYKREAVPEHAAQFRGWADFTKELQERSNGRLLTVGIGGYLNPMEAVLTQYRESLKRGLGTTLFSYNRPVKEKQKGKNAFASSAWETFGKQIYPFFAEAPKPDWRKERAFIAGYLKDENGEIIDGKSIRLSGLDRETRSDGNGFFGFFDLDPGIYLLKAEGTGIDKLEVEALGGKVTWVVVEGEK